MWRKKYYQHPRRLALAAVAKETQEKTPAIAAGLPHLNPTDSEKLDLQTLPPLDAAKCPRFILPDKPDLACGTAVRVFNQDSFDAAIGMPSTVLDIPESNRRNPTQALEAEILNRLKPCAISPEHLSSSTAARVAVLNMASDKNPGGGWLKGASAQEEALCYRSTLAASLHRNMYPIAPRAGLYTRDVVIFRGSRSDGHKLMVPETDLTNLPVVSALSVAAIRRPEVKETGAEATGNDAPGGVEKSEELAGAKEEESQRKDGDSKGKPKDKTIVRPLQFADPAARALTKDKMRLCLRMAAARGHTMLVLGAMGCGAFRNPPKEVANCWLEVLSESEFAGGWFREIWFAVFDQRNEGNFEIFKKLFDGKVVGEVRASSPSSGH
ncbi:hypothetical protein VTK56DRAFT_4988 [Thermocarpiscus australiensis]